MGLVRQSDENLFSQTSRSFQTRFKLQLVVNQFGQREWTHQSRAGVRARILYIKSIFKCNGLILHIVKVNVQFCQIANYVFPECSTVCQLCWWRMPAVLMTWLMIQACWHRAHCTELWRNNAKVTCQPDCRAPSCFVNAILLITGGWNGTVQNHLSALNNLSL